MKAKSSRCTRRLLGLGSAILVSLMGSGAVQGQGREPGTASNEKAERAALRGASPEISMSVDSRFLTFSADPSSVVLELSTVGGYGRRSSSPVYRLYGDGTVVRHLAGKAPETRANLAVEGVSDLLELIVGSGLMEWDSTRIRNEVFSRAGSHIKVADSSSIKLEIALVRYRGPDGVETSPASKQITSPDTFARLAVAPGIPELEAIRDVHELFEEASR